MKLKQIVTERRWRTLEGPNTNKGGTVFLNPTIDELHECGKAARGFIDNDGNVFLWRLDDGEHLDVAKELGEKMAITFYVYHQSHWAHSSNHEEPPTATPNEYELEVSEWSTPTRRTKLDENPNIRKMLGEM